MTEKEKFLDFWHKIEKEPDANKQQAAYQQAADFFLHKAKQAEEKEKGIISLFGTLESKCP